MKKRWVLFWIVAAGLALLNDIDVRGQERAAQQAPVPAPGAVPTFRTSVDLVSSDVIVRNKRGVFQADLSKDDFELYEDGVKQQLTSFVLVHGGRAYTTQMSEVAGPVREGIILPPPRPTNDAAGRMILFIIDDLHIDFRDTIRVKQIFKKMGKELVHEGDLFGVVSTGTSSIAMDLTYDRTRIDDAANKISGSGMRPSEIIQESSAGETPAEVTHRAHVAFSTAYDLLSNLEKSHNRRKAVILISGGYDFDPFAAARNGQAQSYFLNNDKIDPNDPASSDASMSNRFADADLAVELNDLAREANRANATFYTVDPRGLMAGGDLDEQVDPQEWETHVRKQQDSMRSLAEQTGGFAIVNTNDFDKGMKRIDAETSDYYVLAYYSTNPDPTQRRRQVEIRVKKPDPEGGNLDLTYRREYVLKPPPAEKPQK